MAALNEWFFPRGTLRDGPWETVVDRARPGWDHTALHVAALGDARLELPAEDCERLIVPLAGGVRIEHDGAVTELEGRATVFDGPCDVLFVGAGHGLALTGPGRVAVAEAYTTIEKPSRLIARAEVPVELRGAGRDSRQVHNFGTPDTLDAGALLACEVITPAGNWSSHPGHKHDEARAGVETVLEEIYYFEVAPVRDAGAPNVAEAFASFATYSSTAGDIETRALVRTGDVALVPYGYHGPAAAPPEYDLYYLNVMAGPQRAWRFSDDPAQAWIRSRWSEAEIDPRLPYGGRHASGGGGGDGLGTHAEEAR